MQIIVNGEPQEISGGTILDLINGLGLFPERLAVELNLEILPKNRYADTQLGEGDRIEIVHFVGGGSR